MELPGPALHWPGRGKSHFHSRTGGRGRFVLMGANVEFTSRTARLACSRTRVRSEGYTVIWLRIPGHGTSPRALANVSWKDWTAAVEVAVCGLRHRLPDDAPLVLAGYSNGGALSIDYALSSIDDTALPKADAIVLFSPMVGINPMAKITRLYHMVALVSANQKAQWSGINAEIDPFKYSSWPLNANVQAWAVTQAVERKLAALEKAGRMREMPPVNECKYRDSITLRSFSPSSWTQVFNISSRVSTRVKLNIFF